MWPSLSVIHICVSDALMCSIASACLSGPISKPSKRYEYRNAIAYTPKRLRVHLLTIIDSLKLTDSALYRNGDIKIENKKPRPLGRGFEIQLGSSLTADAQAFDQVLVTLLFFTF